MQLIAPFIHAHAFGLENAHAHAIEDVFHNHASSSNFNLHIADVNQQDSIEIPPVIDSVFKVASGVKRNLSNIDVDAVLFACVLMFGLFVRVNKIQVCAFDFSPYPHSPHSPHSPRAPPR